MRPMRRPRWRHRRPLPAMPTHRARPRTSQHTNMRRVPTRSCEITTVRRPDPGRPARCDHTAARSQQQRPGHQHHPTGNQIAIRPAQGNMHGMQEGSHLESIRWQTVLPQVRATTTSPAREQLTRRRQQPAQPSTAQTMHRLRQGPRDAQGRQNTLTCMQRQSAHSARYQHTHSAQRKPFRQTSTTTRSTQPVRALTGATSPTEPKKAQDKRRYTIANPAASQHRFLNHRCDSAGQR